MAKRASVKSTAKSKTPKVGLIMGSDSDWAVMKGAAEVLESFGIPYEKRVVSAHRTPKLLRDYATTARARGLSVIIAGAGGAAHLPGMVAAQTELPVIGVPVAHGQLKGQDALLSIVQMPKGVPVATVAIDNSWNAGVLATQILGVADAKILNSVAAYKEDLEQAVLKKRI